MTRGRVLDASAVYGRVLVRLGEYADPARDPIALVELDIEKALRFHAALGEAIEAAEAQQRRGLTSAPDAPRRRRGGRGGSAS